MGELWTTLKSDRMLALAIFVAALGYFVDVYDLVLFSVLRVASLKDLGLSGDALTDSGALLLNMQLIGFLIGGLIWGVMGDRVGRKQVLFGSILLYSLANIANAFVTDIPQYALCRLLAGIGLAGEIGAGITLVSEMMPRHLRGYGTTIVATVGVMGGVAAGFTGHMLPWETAYIVGGVMGLALLLLRVSLSDSKMFKTVRDDDTVKRGDLKMLLTSASRMKRYIACILVGTPPWFVVAVLITFAPEIGAAMNVTGPLSVATALPLCYLGLTVGDGVSGILSQRLHSRKKVIGLFMGLGTILTIIFLNLNGISPTTYYAFCFAIGFSMGFWVLMLTSAAEQFGTNLRATVATSVPNFVRGTGALVISAFVMLKPDLGVVSAAMIVGLATYAIAAAALWGMRETCNVDLDFIEDSVPAKTA